MIRMICYDISENKARNKFAHFLEAQDFTRLQFSVFVGKVEPQRWKRLESDLEKFHAKHCKKGDRIHSHLIERDHFEGMLVLGEELDKAWIMQEINVLFV